MTTARDETPPAPHLPTSLLVFISGAAGAVLGLVTYVNGWL